MQNHLGNIMKCQVANCNEPSKHTRIETIALDDETCKIHTNLCRVHTLVVRHFESNEFAIMKK